MKNKRRIIGIVAATILALIGTLALVTYVRSATDEAVADEALVEVYVVDEFVPKGAEPGTIESAVSVEQVPARLIASRCSHRSRADRRHKSPPATSNREISCSPHAWRPMTLVNEEVTDKVQISALLEAERAVGGALKKGDLVGVYLSFDPFDVDVSGQEIDTGSDIPAEASALLAPTRRQHHRSRGNRSRRIADEDSEREPARVPQRPRHERADHQRPRDLERRTTSDDEPSIVQVSGTQYVVTIALSPEQSERFVFANEFGKVWLSLDPATVADDGTRPVTLANVYTVVK